MQPNNTLASADKGIIAHEVNQFAIKAVEPRPDRGWRMFVTTTLGVAQRGSSLKATS